jgi:hypothetical protein
MKNGLVSKANISEGRKSISASSPLSGKSATAFPISVANSPYNPIDVPYQVSTDAMHGG